MAISGRFVLLALAGLVPVMLYPGWGTVLLVCLVLCAVLLLDLAMAASPGRSHWTGPCRGTSP